jgi:uncharacterized membrane protein
MRGLAALIMLQGHAFENWLEPRSRDSEWFWLSQFLGGLPAPIFLFLVGVSLALVLDRMRRRDAAKSELFGRVIKRGSWILLLAYAFRIEQFLVWYPASRWVDVFRVDTLNCIGACTIIIGLISAALPTRRQNLVVMGLLTAVVVVITPWVYPVQSGPAFILEYLNGHGNPSYFSVFPWLAFALIGITFGYGLLEARDRNREERFLLWTVTSGLMACAIGMTMSFFPFLEYGFFDYSLTSPHYFLVRIGWLSVILYGVHRWSKRVTAHNWSPMRTLGRGSLLVYWGHMELVYGRPLHDYWRALDIASVMRQLLWLVPSMVILALAQQYGFRRIVSNFAAWLPQRRKECEDTGCATECAVHRIRLSNDVCGECHPLRMESVGPELD